MLIHQAVEQLRVGWHDQDRRIDAYKGRSLNPMIAHDLTVHALDRGVICGSQVSKVLNEWREPRHEAFKPRTLWSWFNAVTETVKGNLGMLPGRTQKLHQLCDACVGLS